MILKKPKNHPHPINDIDIVRVQAVIEKKLDAEWVSIDEINAVRDLIFDKIAADRQTHLGSLYIQ